LRLDANARLVMAGEIEHIVDHFEELFGISFGQGTELYGFFVVLFELK